MSIANCYHLSVLIGCLGLLMTLVIRGKSVFVVAPLCALLGAILSGADPVVRMSEAYMSGFADYIRRFYLIFALGAVFGKLMDESGAAVSIAATVGSRLGTNRAVLSVVLASAVLTYGGVSLFVVGFSVYPLAVHLFRAANLPRQFIPAAIAFGSITFTMTSAGSPEIQNLIPIKYLVDSNGDPLTNARAGWQVSLIVAFLMFTSGQLYLDWAMRRAVLAGGKFEPRANDREPMIGTDGSPSFVVAICPLAATLIALNVLPWLCTELVDRGFFVPYTSLFVALKKHLDDGPLAISLGVLIACCLLRPWLKDTWVCFGDGFLNGFLAVGSTSAVVGFGAAMKFHPGFTLVVDWVTQRPDDDPLLSAAIAVAVIAAIAGSASGGQGIALPIIKPIYVDKLGVSPLALHRVVAIASGTLDSLPANGYLVMLIRNICGETHRRAYAPIFVTTVLIPAVGTALAIVLFRLVPSWG